VIGQLMKPAVVNIYLTAKAELLLRIRQINGSYKVHKITVLRDKSKPQSIFCPVKDRVNRLPKQSPNPVTGILFDLISVFVEQGIDSDRTDKLVGGVIAIASVIAISANS